MPANVGTGTTITFTTSSTSLEVVEANRDGFERADVDTTHLGTSGYKTAMPGDLIDPGELKLKVHHDPATPPWKLLTLTPEIVQIQYPLATSPGTTTTGAKEKVEMFVKSVDGPGIMVDEKMETDITLRCSGPISHTAAA